MIPKKTKPTIWQRSHALYAHLLAYFALNVTARVVTAVGQPMVHIRGARLLTLQLGCHAHLDFSQEDVPLTDVVLGVARDLGSEIWSSLAGRPVRADDAGRATRQVTVATQHTHCVRVRIA